MAALADFTLPARLKKTLEALAPIVCTDEITRLGLTAAVIEHTELMMRAMPTHLRLGLVAGLTTFEAGSLPLHGRAFSSLAREPQEAYFRSWWHSPVFAFRQLAKGVKGLIAMGYFEQPAVKSAMEYHPERWIAEVASRRLRDYAADVARHDALVTAPDPLVPATSLTKKKVNHGKAA